MSASLCVAARAFLVAALAFEMCRMPALAAIECTAISGQQRVAVLELYTSEGCDSCPPADKWVGELATRNQTPAHVIPLAFHVDYWDYTGWRDPYSQALFGERQRQYGRRIGANYVFTPQLFLNGQNYRRKPLFDDIDSRIKAINQTKPRADIRVKLIRLGARLGSQIEIGVDGNADHPRAEIFVAIYENNLTSAVSAGENKGLTLRHDFVVRELVGPLALDASGKLRYVRTFQLDPRWKPHDTYLTVFAQDPDDGDILQALSLSCD